MTHVQEQRERSHVLQKMMGIDIVTPFISLIFHFQQNSKLIDRNPDYKRVTLLYICPHTSNCFSSAQPNEQNLLAGWLCCAGNHHFFPETRNSLLSPRPNPKNHISLSSS